MSDTIFRICHTLFDVVRPEIKFSESTGEEVKDALETYRDAHDFASFEDAIRALLPGWTFEDSTETLVIGDPDSIGIDTSITSIADGHVEFEDAPPLTLPDTDWNTLQINVADLTEQERLHLEFYFDVDYLDDEWSPVDVDLVPSSSLIYGWLSDTRAATLGTIHTLSIPRARLDTQIHDIKQSIGKDVPTDTAEQSAELAARLEETLEQETLEIGEGRDEQTQQQRLSALGNKLQAELPTWMVKASTAQDQLRTLSQALSHIDDEKVQFE